MNNNTTSLALEIFNADVVGISELKKKMDKSVHFLEESGRFIVYPFNEQVIDLFSEVGVDLDVDKTTLKLVYLDTSNNEIKDCEVVNSISKIALEDDGSFDIYDLQTVYEYKEDHPDDFDNARAKLISKVADDINSKANLEDSSDESKDSDDSEDTDLEEIPDEFTDSDDSEDTDLEEIPDEFTDSDDAKDTDSEDDSYSEDALSKMFADIDKSSDNDSTQNNNLETKADPLMESAIRIFRNSTIGIELPTFDQKTTGLLNESIVSANDHVKNAKEKSINRIYESLKATHKKELEKAESHELKQAEQARDKNIVQLKNNCDTKVSKVVEQENQAYSDRKHEVGQAYLKDFLAKYDTEHLHELNENINVKSAPIKSDTEDEIEEENQHFDAYEEKVKQSVFTHVTENINVNEVVGAYKHVVSSESGRLNANAKRLETENEELNKKVADLQSVIRINKDTTEARIKAEVAEKVNESSKIFTDQVQTEIANRRKIEKQLADEQKENRNLTLKVANLAESMTDKNLKDLKALKEESEQESKELLVQESAEPVKQTVVNPETKKPSVWKKVLLGIGILLVVVGACFGGYLSTKNIATPSTNTSSESTQSTNDEPKTFMYTTKDGKKYAVIKDDATSGHYIDDKGVTHTVIFK